MRTHFKQVFPVLAVAATLFAGAAMMSGCSVNPATGENQFAALMSPQQESSVGAQEHQKVLAEYGGTLNDSALVSYVNRVGQKVAANTERGDVQYKFYVLDTPVLNAFALPGGYVYVTRGILALANSESELAAVLAHEVGHITARHTAERYSHGVVTSLGAAVLAAALDSKAAADAANIGGQLYLSSYSRGQESQADDLGIRYLHRAGYDTGAMARFLSAMQAQTTLEGKASGVNTKNYSYFSTHPQTADRVAQARSVAAEYPPNTAETGRGPFMSAIDGMVYGDSADQGFIRGTTFWHPKLGMTFTAPDDFTLINNPDAVIARSKQSGAVVIFDSAANPQGTDPATFLTGAWMKGQALNNVETVDINGKRAATGEFSGRVGNQVMNIRLVAVQWDANTMFRFQIAYPPRSGANVVEGLKNLTYSLRPMSSTEKSNIRPQRIKIVTAKAGDTVASLSSRMAQGDRYTVDRFLTINGIGGDGGVIAGNPYKIVVE